MTLPFSPPPADSPIPFGLYPALYLPPPTSYTCILAGSSSTKLASIRPLPTAPVSKPVHILSPTPMKSNLHMPNVIYLLEQLAQADPISLPSSQDTYGLSNNSCGTPLTHYLETKAQLFPQGQIVVPDSSDHLQKRTRNKFKAGEKGNDVDGSSGSSGVWDGRPPKRARFPSEEADTAPTRWTRTILRIAKGKVQMTPEVRVVHSTMALFVLTADIG
ncbi:hypothetical protein EXIGLDRAFT_718594 [Exidia glandulosa HHB12029]|uniref:Uncharacterized protein n=1 Tax=Exidia glandulosa HHB12029 TaxID=1314781 RepID=A0A165HMU0_EXIGL|nr:hypothetical protein EXIGLDRAFT_718594 [Exidia glandulosa HHB12029]